MKYKLIKYSKRYVIIRETTYGNKYGYGYRGSTEYWWSVDGGYRNNIHQYISRRKAIRHLKRLTTNPTPKVMVEVEVEVEG